MASFKLVVVESPSKIQKLTEYLGPGYRVVASFGHFRDLPADELGIDLSTWVMTYVQHPKKQFVVTKLKDASQGASEVLLATDADREGEAISWHVAQVLRLPSPRRVRLGEITKAGLKRALVEASPLDNHLVDAQQARRAVDRVVGFKVSPLLKPFGSNHSAGRVQSPTLHIVVKRELAREHFKPVPYWTLVAHYDGFVAKTAVETNGKWKQQPFDSQEASLAAEAEARAQPHAVEALETARVEEKPKPPFTTSTLQQAASAQLGFRPKETMALAQALFEKGVITYHRTDSVTVSGDGVELARQVISQSRVDVLPETPPEYRNSDAAQAAHEAIRPTSAKVEAGTTLSADEEQLLGLINRRFLASQCKPALVDRTTVRTRAGNVRFLATGDVIVFDGFRAFLDVSEDDSDPELQKEEAPRLPRLQLEQQLGLRRLERAKKETTPPPRFTQATLVKEMTRLNIGRPATLEPTISTLFERSYLTEEKRSVLPTPRGRLVIAAIAAGFPSLVEPAFTAAMEEQLDQVASGTRNWKSMLTDWYRDFSKQLNAGPAAIAAWYNANRDWADGISDAPKKTGKPCPRCGAELLQKKGQNGDFLSCSARPECTFSTDVSSKPSTIECPRCKGLMEELDGKFGHYARCVADGCGGRVDLAATIEQRCPLCESALRDKGEFYGCETYPKCKFSIDKGALNQAVKSKRACPECKIGLLVVRRGPRGKFLSCWRYPLCRHSEDLSKKSPKKETSRHA